MIDIRRCLLIVVFAAEFFGLGSPLYAGNETCRSRRSQQENLFAAAEYLEHVAYLAGDELEGRGTGEEGGHQAAQYIADFFAKYGVKPGGDQGTYFQEFPLKLKSGIGGGTRVAFGLSGRKTRIPLLLHQDYVPLPFSKSGAFAGDVVFVGYGIVSEDHGYDDYAGLDVSGKIVLMLRGGPEFEDFGSRHTTFRAKANRANARDAAALIFVNAERDGVDPLYPFRPEPVDYSVGLGRSSYGVPILQVTRVVADRLLNSAKHPDLAALQERIEQTKKPVSSLLSGVTIKGCVDIKPVESRVRNVIGIIPGAGPQAEEFIVLGAHYDHLGARNKGLPTFDSSSDIFNGADDNASGTSLVMTLAQVFARGARPNRSILLMAYTGEELGLIGSQYFVSHPTVNLNRCVLMLNFDMVGRLQNDRVNVYGARRYKQEDRLQRLAQDHGLQLGETSLEGYGSDQFSFTQRRIPALFFFTGLHAQYHRATDDVELIDAAGAMRIARLATDLIEEIDALEVFPSRKEKAAPPKARPAIRTQDQP